MRSTRQTRQADQQPGSGFILVVLCFLAFRLFALLLFQYGGIFGSGSDFDYYAAIAQQTNYGSWPYLSYWSEYPPVFPWLVVGVYRFAALFGGLPSTPAFIHLLHAVLLGFDLGNLLLIYSLARRIYGQAVALRSAWVYATLFAPIFIWLGWFDPMPVFWMLLSVWLLARRNTAWAGFACGIGIATKIFPGFVLLVALRQAIGLRPSRRGMAAVLTFAIPCAFAVLLVCLPFLVANPQIFATSVRSWFSRLPWESFWAIADGYYQFGIVPSLPARVGWPAYTSPDVANPKFGVASLLVLAGSLVGVYLAAWDGTPEDSTGLAEEPWTLSAAASALRRVPTGGFTRDVSPLRRAIRFLTLAQPARPPVVVAGLEVAALADDVPIADAAPPLPAADVTAPGATDGLDERTFRLVAFSAALFAVVFLVTSGYSPQFMLWLVPFAVILLPSVDAFVWVTAFTLVALVGERYLYYWYFPPDGPVLAGIVLVRSLLLVLLLAEVLWQIGMPRAAFWPQVRTVAIVVTVVAFVGVSGFMLKTFADGGWGKAVALDPARLATSNLQRTTDQYDAILTFRVADYRYLGPWLGDRALYGLTDPRFATPIDVEQTMRALAGTHSAFVVVDRGSETAAERSATAWLARYGEQISSSVDKTGLRSTRYQIVPGLAWPATPPEVSSEVVISNEVELLGYSAAPTKSAGGQQMYLTLYWKPLRRLGPLDLILIPTDNNGTVGQIGSTYPTTEWVPGEVVVDREMIPADTTTLAVAWRARATGKLLGETTIHLPQSGP